MGDYEIYVTTGNIGDKWCRQNTPGVLPDADYWLLRQFDTKGDKVQNWGTLSSCVDYRELHDVVYETGGYEIDGMPGPDLLTIGVNYGGLIDDAEPRDKYLFVAVNCEPILMEANEWTANSCWYDSREKRYRIVPVKLEFDPSSELFKTRYSSHTTQFVEILVADIGDRPDGCFEVLIKMQNGLNIYIIPKECNAEPVPSAQEGNNKMQD